jgi:hypothetical protein
MNDNGFVILKRALSRTDLLQADMCFRDKTLEYSLMKFFIDGVMMPRINDTFGWDTRYVKFRVSDNNNSADASTFHRDVLTPDTVPMYTCLTYLDRTVMELIPRSHLRPHADLTSALRVYGERIQVTIEPGDILVFNASVLHRGIFTEGLSHRRLVQVFDVFPDPATYARYAPTFVHVPGDEAYSALVVTLSKIEPFISLLNMFGYLNALTGYGRTNERFSSEGLRGRIEIEPNTWQPLNQYVLNNPTRDIDPACRRRHKFEHYTRQHLLVLTVIVLLIILAVA